MNKEIQIIFGDKSFALPGCRFTRTAAIIEVKNEESFKNAFRFLHAATGYNAWWWGDIILAYCDWKKMADASWVHYASEWEGIVGLSAGTLHNFCMVAKAFKSSCRQEDLSWSHHFEIVGAGINDPHEMADWLSRAREEKWSKTALRAALRAAKRSAQPIGDESKPVASKQQELFAAKTWARAQAPRVETMQLDEVERMLADLAPIVGLAHSLAARRQALAGVAKESLSPVV